MRSIILKEMPIVAQNKSNVKVESSAEYTPKQEGVTATGENVKFKDSWNGHKFTPDELEKLLAGETIVISGFKGKKGPYSVKGKFEWQDYKGHKFYGFKLLEFLN